jgi:hypothetical protein
MAHTACLVCIVSTVSGRSKNTLRRPSASGGHITKLEQYLLFLDNSGLGIYLFVNKARWCGRPQNY